jgi:hypothetical protein
MLRYSEGLRTSEESLRMLFDFRQRTINGSKRILGYACLRDRSKFAVMFR